MERAWRDETSRVARSFDAVADLYREEFASELDAKPFDRAFLADLASRVSGRTAREPVLEVGAGPGHVSASLAAHGVDVLASDASVGSLAQARILDAGRVVVAADLARLPVRPGSLGAIVAFYCLIYGAREHLDAVFADWRRALAPEGLVAVAVHAGEGTIELDHEWHRRPIDLAIVLRDPDDLVRRLARNGFVVEACTTRAPYAQEHATTRCYLLARRTAAEGEVGA